MQLPVAKLRTRTPTTSAPFLARGVVPCPPEWSELDGFRSDLYAELAGRPLHVQVQPCRWDHRLRPAAIEVSVLVDEPTPIPGGVLELDLFRGAQPRNDQPPRPGMFARLFLHEDFSIHLGVLDATGKRWTFAAAFNPDDPGLRIRRHRFGPLITTLEFSGVLRATDAACPLPFKARGPNYTLWLTMIAGEDVVLATLSIDTGTPAGSGTPALPTLDVEGLEVQVAGGAELEHKFPEPEALPAVELDALRWAHPFLGADRRDVWRQRQERAWRFALFPSGSRSRARALLDNLGFAVPKVEAGLWSWGNPNLCGYLAQGARVPDLAHLHADQRIPGAASATATLVSRRRSGAVLWNGGGSPRMGLWHPWGVAYGGMTGGSEIDQLLGIELAAGAPDCDRLLEYQLRAEALLARQPTALYGDDARPFALETVSNAAGALPWNAPMFNGLLPKGDGPLGFLAAEAGAQRAPGAPSYEAELLKFAPMDEQHLVRFTGPWKVLAALDFDPLAIRLLSLQAELVRGHLWEGSGGVLRGMLASATSRPFNGGPLGRGEGWASDAVAQSWIYRLRPWRNRFQRWALDFLGVVGISRTPQGVWLRRSSGKIILPAPFNSQHGICQTIEHGIVGNGALGLWRAVGPMDPDVHDKARAALIAAASSGLRYLWRIGAPDSFSNAAVGPIAAGSDPYPDTVSPLGVGGDSWQVQNLMGYGLDLVDEFGGPAEYAILRGLIRDWTQSAANPVAWMHSKGWSNLPNRAALLAALQQGL